MWPQGQWTTAQDSNKTARQHCLLTVEGDVAMLKRLRADAVAGNQRHLQRRAAAAGGMHRSATDGSDGKWMCCRQMCVRLIGRSPRRLPVRLKRSPPSLNNAHQCGNWRTQAPSAVPPSRPHHVGACVALHHSCPVRVGAVGGVWRFAADGCGVEQDLHGAVTYRRVA